MHYGLCNDGLVPRCYGFADFPDWNPSRCPPHPNQPDHWAFFRNNVRSPMALFLEYFPNMKHVGFYNFTVGVANAALSILTRIHEAQILHYDFVPWNILVSPGGRVVIVCTAPYSYFPCLVSFTYDPRLILAKYTFIQPTRLLSAAQLAVL